MQHQIKRCYCITHHSNLLVARLGAGVSSDTAFNIPRVVRGLSACRKQLYTRSGKLITDPAGQGQQPQQTALSKATIMYAMVFKLPVKLSLTLSALLRFRRAGSGLRPEVSAWQHEASEPRRRIYTRQTLPFVNSLQERPQPVVL